MMQRPWRVRQPQRSWPTKRLARSSPSNATPLRRSASPRWGRPVEPDQNRYRLVLRLAFFAVLILERLAVML
jgi:hypothetical protein